MTIEPGRRIRKATAPENRLEAHSAPASPDGPTVSVITAVLNGYRHIEGCIRSVQDQDYPSIEHIVLDGGSTDGTIDVLRRYDGRLAFWASEPDSGIYDAWNKALRLARGKWICFLGGDDEFLPGAVGAYMALASANPEAEYLCSSARLLLASGKEQVFGRQWNWSEFSRQMLVCHVGSMHRRSLFERLGSFDSSYKIAGDYELLLRAGTSLRCAFLSRETVLVRAGGVCHSANVFYESCRAKYSTGAVPKWLAKWDRAHELMRFRARSFLHDFRKSPVANQESLKNSAQEW
jgi:glycosyltransferase involved in cell wall biosynthesis